MLDEGRQKKKSTSGGGSSGMGGGGGGRIPLSLPATALGVELCDLSQAL